MKKVFLLLTLLSFTLLLTGCTSNITAKYDDYNETFTGKSYYDSLSYRATINVKSNKNGAVCLGNAKIYTYPVWQFKLTCSDGRMIKGIINSGDAEGKAFTNRNETITFSVVKKQKKLSDIHERYESSIQGMPSIDSSKQRIQPVMND